MTEPINNARDYFRSRSADELIVLLSLADSGLQRKAARELGRRGAVRAIPRLVELLDAPEPMVREAATEALGEIPLPDAERASVAEKIAQLMVQPDEPAAVRNTCAFALARLRYPPAFDRLVSMLGDADVSVRVCAVAALAAIGGPFAYEVLHNVQYAESDPYAREQIRRALAALGASGTPGRFVVFVSHQFRAHEGLHIANVAPPKRARFAMRLPSSATSGPPRSHGASPFLVGVLAAGIAAWILKATRDSDDSRNAPPDETGLRLRREAVS